MELALKYYWYVWNQHARIWKNAKFKPGNKIALFGCLREEFGKASCDIWHYDTRTLWNAKFYVKQSCKKINIDTPKLPYLRTFWLQL